ncbi:hypothetical protein [Bythopirellula polymerisocia]|uniref:Uncharacterized protein n=1 Tax=Bythopirellula polymerisocia TaxID=2528003 RepID=A0A5C6CED5_9BACT|nr:hypothetical protein [Bythopirellula polymerisocia]TWU22628.1 hypothetical protein Pla144_40880 [Bythopirellula polymerisocia]
MVFCVAAGLMLRVGWVFLPGHIGAYYVSEDFSKVREQFYLWIWMCRVRICGMVITAITLLAVAAILAEESLPDCDLARGWRSDGGGDWES